MKLNKNFISKFAMLVSKQKGTNEDSFLILKNQMTQFKNISKDTNNKAFESMKFKFAKLCIEILEEIVPVLSKKQVSRLSFRLSSGKSLDDLESLINQLGIEINNRIVVKTNVICVDYVLKTSVLKEFVFTNFCLNLPQLTHLIKYNKSDLEEN